MSQSAQCRSDEKAQLCVSSKWTRNRPRPRRNAFSKASIDGETRGEWYLRQMRGSANLSGGKLFHILSGNLSHQIEHHLFPEVPAHRYAEMSIEMQEIAQRYGQHYNKASLFKQFGTVAGRILRHALPSKPTKEPMVLAKAEPVALARAA